MDTKDYKDTVALFKPLHERMDETINTYRLEKYTVLTDKYGKAMPNTSQIILNDPRVFGDAVLSILAEDKQSFDITGVDPAIQKNLEDVFKLWLYLNDDMLGEQEIEPLDVCLNFQSSFRGWIGVLPLIYYDAKAKKYLPTVIPLDPRWLYWKRGARGLKWSANLIRMDKEQCEETYKIAIKTNKPTVDIICKWGENDYTLHTAGEDDKKIGVQLSSVAHNFGFCPTITVPRPLMPHLISTDSSPEQDFKYQGEDIYAPVRQTIKDMNEFASIWATINRQQFETPMALENASGTNVQGVNIWGYGMLIPLKAGQKFVELPSKDMSATAVSLFRELFARWERATLSSVNFGQAGDRQSALAIADLKSDRNKIINPSRKHKALVYRKIANMWRRMVQGGHYYRTTITEENAIDEKEFKEALGVFEKKFVINVNYDSVSPQENIANAQLAATLVRDNGLPRSWAWRNILHVDDPEGLLREAEQDALEKMMPAVVLAKGILSWTEDKDATQKEINELLAEIGKKELRKLLEQQESAVEQPPNPASQPKTEITTSKPNSNKLARMQEERAGQAAMRRGQAAQREK